MKNKFSNFFRYFSILILSVILQVNAAQDGISKQPSVRLGGHVPSKALMQAHLLQPLDSTKQVPVTFVLPLRNQEALEELIQRIHNPADHQYFGKYLSAEEFGEQFSPTQEDYDNVIAYAQSIGLTVSGTHPNRTLLNTTGQTAFIERGFNLSLNQYQTASGRTFHAPNDNPEVPVSIASIINGIVGLDNHAVWHPFHIQKETIKIYSDAHEVSNETAQTIPSGPGGGYAPNDLLKAYNLSGVSAKGSGQIIALFELGGYQSSDIEQYTAHFGLPSAKLQNVLVDGGSGTGIDAEVTLDIELALALAPESQIYVYEGPNSDQGVLDTYNRIATDNIAKQVSTSWGIAEDLVSVSYLNAENAIFLQMAAHGQTIYAAAGDSGALDDPNKTTPVVDDPASQPYVVGVGGTKLIVNSATGVYQSESVWNNGAGNGAGGGGISGAWPIPLWQATVPSAYSKTNRNVPDVSLNADPNTGYSIYYNGQWTIFGGTSCAAPLWSAFTALVNQERAAGQIPLLGFANPTFYAIGSGPSGAADFYDVTLGNNLFYSAGVGYDNATGWGSFNGTNLFLSLTNSIPKPPLALPLLNILMKHNSPFSRGVIGTYKIVISNQGTGHTSGPVSVAIILPKGLTYSSFSGSGWTYNAQNLTFTQNNMLQPGLSYPTITLNVNVSSTAPSVVIPIATVSGGGSASSTITNLTTVR